MPRYVGVDPGLGGALGWFDPDKPRTIHVLDTPTIAGEVNCPVLVEMIRDLPPDFAVVERVKSFQGGGAKASFTFGGAYFAVRATLAALGVPVLLVQPAKWKAAYQLTGKDKAESRAKATLYWPESADLFKRVKDDGRAEAALIARWGAYNWEQSNVVPHHQG